MRPSILPLLALLGLATAAQAGDVPDGSTWTSGNHTVTVDVTDTLASSVSVTFTDDSGTSSAVAGEEGGGSTPSAPTCSASDEGTTPAPGANKYRVKDGKVQRKNKRGTWVDMTKKKKPKPKPTGTGFRVSSPGEEISSLPDPD